MIQELLLILLKHVLATEVKQAITPGTPEADFIAGNPLLKKVAALIEEIENPTPATQPTPQAPVSTETPK
jgi:hypothetical protein